MPNLIKRAGIRLALLACVAVLAGGCASITTAMGINQPGVPGATPGQGLANKVGCIWGAGTPVATPVVAHPIGQAVPLGPLTITVNGAFCQPPAGLDPPVKNLQFVIIELTVTNHGKVSRDVSSTFEARLVDGSGNVYAPDVTASANADSPISSPLEAGGSRTGEIGFAVPTTVTGLTFVFSSHPFGNEGDIRVAIH
ncbi:MAG TPA: DUF4352 domain-containing protein [Thermomicrobiaceae bacterium]|nr:DUF4352 domain-containing protein [Thermomicrobiaceae bacterium]